VEILLGCAIFTDKFIQEFYMDVKDRSNHGSNSESNRSTTLSWLFVLAGGLAFVIGFANLMDEPSMKWLLLTFFVAPMLVIYPILRYLFGFGKGVSSVFSAVLAFLFYLFVKEKIDKSSK
jgi:hypothetical protein